MFLPFGDNAGQVFLHLFQVPHQRVTIRSNIFETLHLNCQRLQPIFRLVDKDNLFVVRRELFLRQHSWGSCWKLVRPRPRSIERIAFVDRYSSPSCATNSFRRSVFSLSRSLRRSMLRYKKAIAPPMTPTVKSWRPALKNSNRVFPWVSANATA